VAESKVKVIASMIDGFVKSQKRLMIVIPAKAGIQCFEALIKSLDTGFHR
jgi:hypothetical protein